MSVEAGFGGGYTYARDGYAESIIRTVQGIPDLEANGLLAARFSGPRDMTDRVKQLTAVGDLWLALDTTKVALS